MYKVKSTSQFKRSIRLAKKRNKDISLLYSIIDKLQHGITLDEKHHDHPLKGSYKGFRECHI